MDDGSANGVAHLARSLDLEPKNSLAAMRLYSTIAFGAPDRAALLRCVLPQENWVHGASFSPDGTRIVLTVPLARLMSAKFEENPQRAAFLRDYDLKRLPDHPELWVRAAQSLHEQKDDPGAGQALQKLENFAPENAAALRRDLAL